MEKYLWDEVRQGKERLGAPIGFVPNPLVCRFASRSSGHDKDSCLLKVGFYKGKKNWKRRVYGGVGDMLIDESDLAVLGDTDFETFVQCSTFCTIEVGEISVVYLQAQILALVDYLQEGVLGVLFPPDDAEETVQEDINAEETGESLFKIRSNTVRLLLPMSPSSTEKMELHLEGLHILHHNLPDSTGGKTKGLLGKVMLVNNAFENMCKERISISIDVALPPSMAIERVTVVKIGIRDIELLLTHECYQCLMR